METKNFLQNIPNNQTVAINKTLEKLTRYLSGDRFMVVGGLAIRYHLAVSGVEYPSRSIDDIDLVIDEPGVISPSITLDFLIYHHHVGTPLVYFALVDPESKIKVDIFTKTDEEESVSVSFSGKTINIPRVEDQFVKIVADMLRISEVSKIDPIELTNAQLLRKIVDINLADKIWEERKYPQFPLTLYEAIHHVEKIGLDHPDWVKERPFRRMAPYICPECVNSIEFPITPMAEIYRVLGYVE